MGMEAVTGDSTSCIYHWTPQRPLGTPLRAFSIDISNGDARLI
jgi:hypothetical protein